MLLTMRSSVAAGRAMTMYAALQLDLGRHETDPVARAHAQARGELLIPITKGWSTETGIVLASLGVQVHGGMGFIEETGAAQHYRDVRITTIYEGTTGIQAIDLVGRKVGRDGGVAMRGLITDMRSELSALRSGASGQLAESALEGIDLLDVGTQVVLDAAIRGGQYVQAIAVPYLHLAGVTIGAWLMTKSHAIASMDDRGDPEFALGKRADARFYVAHVLPQALALSRIVTAGADSVVDVDIA
jgi:hypothetical protein